MRGLESEPGSQRGINWTFLLLTWSLRPWERQTEIKEDGTITA